MTMPAHDSSARWRTFLTEAKDDDSVMLLSKQSPPYVEVTFHELQGFDPEFAEDVLALAGEIHARPSSPDA